MSLHLTDDKSTLVQVMHQAITRAITKPLLEPMLTKSLLPYGISRPRCVNTMPPNKTAAIKADFLKWSS